MREHVRRFIRECPCCQKMIYLKISIHAHPFTVASYEPFERVEMDTIGPLPEDEEGYKYILVIIDCFTRWVNLYPIKDTTAEECAKRMIHHVGTFGCPTQIQTDKGLQFENQLMEELFRSIGVHHLINLAYSKEKC